MYKVKIAGILKEFGKKQTINETLDLKLEDDLYNLSGPVKVDLTAENLGDLVLLTGQQEAKVTLDCVRCAQKYEHNLKTEVEQEYRREDKLLQFNEEDKKVGIDEFRFVIDEDNCIDIEEAAIQEIILALPLKPICGNCHNAVNYSTKTKE